MPEDREKNINNSKKESVFQAGSYSAKRKENGVGSLKEIREDLKNNKENRINNPKTKSFQNNQNQSDPLKQKKLSNSVENSSSNSPIDQAKNMLNSPFVKNYMNQNKIPTNQNMFPKKNINPLLSNPFHREGDRKEAEIEEEDELETEETLENESRPDFLGIRSRKSQNATSGSAIVSAGIRGFLKKSLPFLLPILAVVIVCFIFIFVIISSINSFSPALGISSILGNDIEEEFEANDKEEEEFYERIKKINDEYSEKGITIEAELIGGVYFILQNYDPNISMSDFDDQMIRKIVDAMFDEVEEGETPIYDKDIFVNNLISDIFPKLIPKVDADLYPSIADEIFKYIEDYEDLIGKQDEDAGNGICIEGNLQASALAKMSQKEYIETLGPIAQRDYSRTGVFASVTIAQSIVESGWAKSGLSVGYNNMFGIKCGKTWVGKCVKMGTQEEYTPGSISDITAGFRVYNSVDESLYDHSLVLQRVKSYTNAGVFRAKNGKDQIKAIKRGGYATSSSYVTNITNIINTYNLEEWDVTVNTNTLGSNCLGASSGEWDIRTKKPTKNDFAFNLKNQNRGQCVWYAQARAIEVAQNLASKGKLTKAESLRIQNLLMGIYGNAGEWYNKAVLSGKFNGSKNIKDLKAGSIIVWSNGNSFGHVAFIEDVDTSKNSVTITEGWATSGNSCPNSWGCVNFKSNVMSIDEYYRKFGPYYNGTRHYRFVGYVYTLEPKS